MDDYPIKRTTDAPVATCEDNHGLTWGLFPDESHAYHFGDSPWRTVPTDEMASSIVDHLADGGDQD